MSDLNFLPKDYWDKAKRAVVFTVWKGILSWVTFILLLSSNILLWGGYFLEKELSEWEMRVYSINNRSPELVQEITKINTSLGNLDQIQQDYIVWSKILLEFSELIPKGTKLNNLNINAKTSTFKMEGFSFTRKDLLQLQENLNKSNLIVEVEAPLSNLLKSENIDFKFSGKIDLSKFKDLD